MNEFWDIILNTLINCSRLLELKSHNRFVCFLSAEKKGG